MAVNQAQVDHIISSASADDPEVRLLKLQDEVDLLKTSIKRLLIDIRERMNDIDNPFNVSSSGGAHDASSNVANVLKSTADAVTSAAGALKSTTSEQTPMGGQVQSGSETQQGSGPEYASPPPAASPQGQRSAPDKMSDEEFLKAVRSRISGVQGAEAAAPAAQDDKEAGKVRLQKVFRLFAWTTKNVRLYGHDRVDLMLESYSAMGYISAESCALVKDIARLMPNSLGEQHEIQAGAYVTELYELNHILNPGDLSLDRDMIEVLMQQRGSAEREQRPAMIERTGEDIPSRDAARKTDRI